MDHSATLTAKSSKNSSKSGNYKDHNLICKIGTLRTHKDGRGFREVSGDVSPAIPARAREDGSGQPVIWDTYNNSVRKDKVTCTLTHNTGSSSLRAGQKVILRGKKKR